MKISYAKKEQTILRIIDHCSFLTEEWEEKWMHNALHAAFNWAEQHSESINKSAPYAIVNFSPQDHLEN